MTPLNTFIADLPVDPASRDHRNNDGIDVRPVWNSQSSRVWVFVEDERSGEALRFGVPAADALDAFRHPYTYANRERAKHRVAAASIGAR